MSFKNVIVMVIMILLFTFTIGASDFNLSEKEKVEDFNAMYNFVRDNCPYLWVKERLTGENWLNRREEFLKKVVETSNDLEFYQVMNEILQELGNGHSHLISPSYYQNIKDLPLPGAWDRVLNNEEVNNAYNYWEKVIKVQNIISSFYARYMDGNYWVIYSFIPELPVGAKIISIDGVEPDQYISREERLYKDPVRNKYYSRFLPVPDKKNLKVVYQSGKEIKEVTIPGRVARGKVERSGQVKEKKNVITEILNDDRVAYIRIKSFAYNNIEQDKEILLPFYIKIKDFPYIIIDIRGNSGGADSYWKDLIVSPLINKPMIANFYAAYRSGEYVQEFVNSSVGPAKVFMRVGRNTLLKRMDLPSELLTEKYMDPLKLPYICFPKNSVRYQGKVILLVDNMVYSAAESFAAYAKATGWATLVGTRTGGDGIGLTPIKFVLPNSKLLVRMPETIGLNPDGTFNEEHQTIPDLYIDYDPQGYIQSLYNGSIKEDGMVNRVLALLKEEEFPFAENKSGGLLSEFFKDYDGDYGYPVEEDPWKFDGMNIHEIKIVGAFKTDESLLRKQLEFKEGDEFYGNKLILAQSRIEELNAHTSVSLDVKKIDDKNVKVIVFIQEGGGFALSPVNLSYRIISDITDNRLSYTQYNVGKRMVNITGVYGLSSARERYLTVTSPFYLGFPTKLNLSFGTYNTQRTVNLGKYKGNSYLYKNDFIDLSDTIILQPETKLRAGIKYISEDLVGFEGEEDLNLRDINYLSGSVKLYRDIYTLTAGALVELSKGYKSFPVIEMNASNEIKVKKDIGLYLRGKAGWMVADMPFNHLYAIGGEDTFIAYPQSSLIGNRYISLGTELRKYFNNNLYIALVLDGGEVWNPDEKLELKEPYTGVGLALRYRTPVGLVLKGFYAYDPGQSDQDRVLFGIGKDF